MQNSMTNKGPLQETSENPREFSFEFLQDITDNFSNERIIGRGAFGAVYKVCLSLSSLTIVL
jgi:hypothetical protein